jgi:hypothetical protein
MIVRILRQAAVLFVCFAAIVGCNAKSTSDSNPARDDDRPRAKKSGDDKAGFFEWAGGQSPYQLVNRESVRADLGVTAEQYAAIEQAAREESAKASAARKERNELAGKPSNRTDLKGTAAMMRALDETVQKTLSEKQNKRLEQIAIQYCVHHHGVLWLFNRTSIQQKLALTSSQQEMVSALAREESKTIAEIRQSRNPGAVKPTLDRFYQSANDKLLTSLSTEQQTKWQEVLGPPFDFANGGFAVKN